MTNDEAKSNDEVKESSAVHRMNSDPEVIDAGIQSSEAKIQPKSSEVKVEVQPSDTPIQERLKRAYIDEYNTLKVSDMKPEQVRFHIADIEDNIKILQTQLQAALDVDNEWAETATAAEREIVRKKDKAYRNQARPAMNADGTIKTTKPREAKPVVLGDAGSQAFENLVEKLIKGGLTRENAIKLLKGGK